MVEIKILLFRKNKGFHYFTHTEALIQSGEKSLRIVHANASELRSSMIFTNPSRNKKYEDKTKQWSLECCSCVETITLQSNQDFNTFVMNYFHQYGDPNSYQYFTNNCADAVNFALDYFFPQYDVDAFYKLYTAACCWFCLGSLGMTCFPVPFIKAPCDVFKKAKILQWLKPNDIIKQEEKTPAYICDSTAWDKTTFKKSTSARSSLSLAIMNAEPKIIDHFLEKHFNELSDTQIIFAYLCAAAMSDVDSGIKLVNRKPNLLKQPAHDANYDEKSIAALEDDKEHFAAHALNQVKDKLSDIELIELVNLANINNKIPFQQLVFLTRPSISQAMDALLLGSVLLSLIQTNQLAAAESLLTNRPDTHKDWYLGYSSNQAHHLLIMQNEVNMKLLTLFCEKKPVADLKHANRDNKNVMNIAIDKKHTAVVKYFVEKHAERLRPEDLVAAKEYLASVACHPEQRSLRRGIS